MMLYELSFVTVRPYLYKTHNRNNRRVLRQTLEEALNLADEMCLAFHNFELLDNLSLLLNENDGAWKTVYDTPITYINMFLRRYNMHICLVSVRKEDVAIM